MPTYREPVNDLDGLLVLGLEAEDTLENIQWTKGRILSLLDPAGGFFECGVIPLGDEDALNHKKSGNSFI